ncbi:MAG: hypothetical protein QW385_04010 [Thermoproteota archaeon]
MERTIKMFNGNLVLVISFSMLIMISMALMLLKASEFRIIPGDLGSTDFIVELTSDYVIIENPYGNIIASYSISTPSNTVSPKEAVIKVFPLKLPRVIEAYNKTVYIRSWDFHVYNVLRINYTEVKGGHFSQKTYAVDLRFHFEDLSYADSSFKTVLETIETPHEPKANETLSGSLEPLTGQLYGGFYLPSGENIKIVIKWEPADKPIVATVYHEEGKIENYLLKDGEWSGFLKAVDTGLNCLIVWNPAQNGNITYYSVTLNP